MTCTITGAIALGIAVVAGDGDNLVAEIDGQRENMRICGIDAPETHFGVEPGGPEAAAHLAELVRDRRIDIYATPQGRDRYGRYIVVAVLPDGTDIGLLQVITGHAVEDCRYSGERLWKM